MQVVRQAKKRIVPQPGHATKIRMARSESELQSYVEALRSAFEQRGSRKAIADAPLVKVSLGPPVVPLYPFVGEGSPTEVDYRRQKLVPVF